MSESGNPVEELVYMPSLLMLGLQSRALRVGKLLGLKSRLKDNKKVKEQSKQSGFNLPANKVIQKIMKACFSHMFEL